MCDQEFRTQRIDPRYPNQNQTKCMNVNEAKGVCKDRSKWCSVVSAYPRGKKAACYDNYCDYYKCRRLLGDVDDCKIFKRYFETICPNGWISHWDDLREKGAFPGPI